MSILRLAQGFGLGGQAPKVKRLSCVAAKGLRRPLNTSLHTCALKMLVVPKKVRICRDDEAMLGERLLVITSRGKTQLVHVDSYVSSHKHEAPKQICTSFLETIRFAWHRPCQHDCSERNHR